MSDSFEQAVSKTLSILHSIRFGFGPYPTASRTSLDLLKTAGATCFEDPEPARDEPLPASESARFETLRKAALACVKCPHLVKSRTQVVFGVGSLKAELMFVGEAPGAEEDLQGQPFVGRAGQLLTKIIQAMGFRRDEVYIANVLKCRPDMPPGPPATASRRRRKCEPAFRGLRSKFPWSSPG